MLIPFALQISLIQRVMMRLRRRCGILGARERSLRRLYFQWMMSFSAFHHRRAQLRAVRGAGIPCRGAGRGVHVAWDSCHTRVHRCLGDWDRNVRRDLEAFMSRPAPARDPRYEHETEEAHDRPSHTRTLLTQGVFVTPTGEAQVQFGTRREIYLWEYRTGAREHRVIATVW